MHRLLIPLLACLFLSTPALLRAQVPHEINYAPFDIKKFQVPPPHPDAPCGSAGTFTFGQFIGSSNDVSPSPIFLCFGDSLLVQHNGDADLSGDPDPTSQAGIAYGFYQCPPTSTGPTLQDIIGSPFPPPGPDPCLLNTPPSATGMYQTPSVPNGGGTWFFNSGNLQAFFNMGQPLSVIFAPITVDNVANNGYESIPPIGSAGPCVAVGTNSFEIIYLNEITATGINNNFGNDCLGRFTVRGGYPQYDNTAVYTISITLASNPAVKAIIYTAAASLFHLSSVSFSVPQAGLYNVVIEDGKSCPASFQMDMSVCNPVDNVFLTFPDTIVPPGGTICVPVIVDNFELLAGTFSVEWDETVLQFNGYQNVNSVIDTVFGPINLNSTQTTNGLLGVQIFNNINPTASINIPDGSILLELCFTAIGQLGDCSGMGVTNSPTGVLFEDSIGQTLALSVDTGQICIAFLPLSFSTAVIDTTCLGQGTLKVTPVGGVGPYEVTVDVLPTGPTYNGIVANSGEMFIVPSPVGNTNNTPVTIDVCVQDNNGLGATQCTTIVVDIKRLLSQINFSVAPAHEPLCNGDANGVINAVVLQGGVVVPNPGPNYTYAWSPAVPSPTGPLQNGVLAGPYSLTVTDLNTGCSDVASGSLGQPAKISPQLVTIIPASCTGACDGTIIYEAEGGVPLAGSEYQYTWINEATNTVVGSGTDNPIILGNICAGEYTVSITDANGCMFVDSNLTMTDFRALTITQDTVRNVLCNGGSTGSIRVTVIESMFSGLGYTFTWTGPGFTQVDNSPTSTYSNLPVGIYTVLAQDNLGCKVTDTIEITEPAVLRIDSLAQVNPGCAQPNTGTINVSAGGGAGGPTTFDYIWSNSATTSTVSGLPFGTYTVTVTDINNCTVTREFNLPEPTPPDVTVTIAAPKCGGDGALTATSQTGFLYVWTDINGVVIDSTATIDTLPGGDYIVQVFDATGCLSIDTVTLADVVPLSFSDTTLQEPTCFGFNNGQIAIGVQDGQPPYTTYLWDPQPLPNQSVIFGLTAGNYALTVTDNAGCTLTGMFQLNEPPEIVLTFDPTVIGRVKCFDSCDGSATPLVSYNGPQPGGSFSFLWEDGGTDSLRLLDLCAGFNSLTVTDGFGCFDTASVEITSPTQIGFTGLAPLDTKCYGDSTGSLCLTAVGGNGGPYSYLWNWQGVTANCIANVPAGPYTVTLTDLLGCTHSIDTLHVDQPEQMTLTTSTQPLSCFGGENGQADVTVLGGVPNYTFAWEDASGMNAGGMQHADMLSAGTYVVVVKDMNGCTASASATLQDPPPVVGDYNDWEPLTCNGDETILSILSISGGAGAPYKFSVDFGAVLDPAFPVTISGGEHFITYYDVQDCAITDSIFVPEPAPITVSFNPDVIEIELGATADLEPIITGAAVIGGFSWTNPEFLLNADTLNATAYTFSNLTYTLTVMDTFGCSGVGSVHINVDPNRNVYLPNIFHPADPNGLNGYFNIFTGLGVDVVNFFRVYDRWGELMYEKESFLPNNDNLGEGWDGRYNGDFVNPGVFVYLAEVRFLDGRVLLYRGDVTVIR